MMLGGGSAMTYVRGHTHDVVNQTFEDKQNRTKSVHANRENGEEMAGATPTFLDELFHKLLAKATHSIRPAIKLGMRNNDVDVVRQLLASSAPEKWRSDTCILVSRNNKVKRKRGKLTLRQSC